MDYVIAIPSYQRPKELFSKSINTLITKKVDLDRVHVFLHEHDPYLDDYLSMADITGVATVVTKTRGIGQQRMAIMDHFPEGQHICCMDDDIEGVMSATSKHWRDAFEIEDLHAEIQTMFDECVKRKIYVWGLSPVDNPFFMNVGHMREGLALVMFTLFGFINRPGHPVHKQTVRYKDEQELSLRAWWYDGSILRNDGLAVRTKFFTEGGCQADGRDYDQVEESVVSLMEQWPGLIRRSKRRSAWPEVTLAPRKGRHEGHSLDIPPPGLADLL